MKQRCTINQPLVGGEIRLQPDQNSYYKGTEVKVTFMTDIGYEFQNWTYDLESNENPLTFTVNDNMTIGVNVTEKSNQSTVVEVDNVNDLKAALQAMEPGEEIIVEDGDYSLGSISLKNLGGTIANPVIVRAKNIGKARFTDKTNFTLNECQNIIFQGFNFDLEHVSCIFKLEGSSYIRITRNEFRMNSKESQSSKWINIGEVWKNDYCRSRYNRIDHNLFEGKYDNDPWIIVDGSHGSVPDISKYDRIDHNHFRYNQPRVTNEKETLRIGVSDLSLLSSYCTIEHNLFEECDGDPEVISIKSCDNIIRNNTFLRSLGTLSLRHGFRNRVEGNYFFGEGKTDKDGNGCGGIRVYGLDHIIINNYFEGLSGSKWDAAITITNGDVVNTSSSLTSHFLPENVTVAFNTMVNNTSNIEIGFDNNGKYKRAPQNCLIANNIIINDTNPIIKSYSDASLAGVKFKNNIMYPTGTSTIGILYSDDEIKVVDPKLIKTMGRTPEHPQYIIPFAVYKLSANSEARNAAKGSYEYITVDSEGQNRTGTYDIGADEYNADDTIIYGVLGADHVGVYGTLEDYETYDPGNITNVCKKITEREVSIYPNPVTDILHIQTENAIEIMEVISLQGEILVKTSEHSLSLGELVSGTYLLSICYKDGQTYKTKIIKK